MTTIRCRMRLTNTNTENRSFIGADGEPVSIQQNTYNFSAGAAQLCDENTALWPDASSRTGALQVTTSAEQAWTVGQDYTIDINTIE